MNKKIFPFRYKVAAGRLGVRDVHEAPVPQQRGDAQRPARLHRPRHKLQLRRGHHQQGTHQGTPHQQGTHQGTPHQQGTHQGTHHQQGTHQGTHHQRSIPEKIQNSNPLALLY